MTRIGVIELKINIECMQIQKGFNFPFVDFVFLSGRNNSEFSNVVVVLKGKKKKLPSDADGPWLKEMI